MLASDTTIVEKGLEDTLNVTSSKFFHVLFDICKTRMKRKLIWKNINNMISRFKFFVEKTKGREKFITLIIISIRDNFN